MNNILSQVLQKVFLIIGEIWAKEKSERTFETPCTFVNKPITWLAAVVSTKGDAWNANIELFKFELKSLLPNQSRAWWKGRRWKFCRK